jgi:hypothetical protein
MEISFFPIQEYVVRGCDGTLNLGRDNAHNHIWPVSMIDRTRDNDRWPALDSLYTGKIDGHNIPWP